MYFCANCGAPYQDSDVPAVCKSCGKVLKTDTPIAPEAPAAPEIPAAPEAPVQASIYQSAPVYQATPVYEPVMELKPVEPGAGAKVMAIIGMVLGINCVAGALGTLIYAFLYFSGAWTIGIECIAAGIAALILSGKAVNKGLCNGMTKAAKITSIIGIIVNGVALFISIILLASGYEFPFDYAMSLYDL